MLNYNCVLNEAEENEETFRLSKISDFEESNCSCYRIYNILYVVYNNSCDIKYWRKTCRRDRPTGNVNREGTDVW